MNLLLPPILTLDPSSMLLILEGWRKQFTLKWTVQLPPLIAPDRANFLLTMERWRQTLMLSSAAGIDLPAILTLDETTLTTLERWRKSLMSV